MKTPIFAVAAFLSFMPLAFAAEPAAPDAGYFISEPDLALNIIDIKPPYTMEIKRIADSPQAAQMLKKAEAVYPRRETVLAAAKNAHFKLRQTPDAKESLWWSSAFDGVRIPYALTAGAVVYYQNLMEAFTQNDFSGSANIKMTRASLKYTASIKLYHEWKQGKQTFKNVYVADMTLNWSQVCGRECAMGFAKTRIVVLGQDGSIRAVFGDGNAGVAVS